jgi:hypothetical protein
MKDSHDVIMAGYQSLEPAQKNLDALVKLIKDKQLRSEGVILVQQNADGKVLEGRYKLRYRVVVEHPLANSGQWEGRHAGYPRTAQTSLRSPLVHSRSPSPS